MFEYLMELLTGRVWGSAVRPIAVTLIIGAISAVAGVVYAIFYNYFLYLVNKLVQRTHNQWDNRLMEAGFFRRVVCVFSLILIYVGVERLLVPYGSGVLLNRLVYALIVLSLGRVVHSLVVWGEDVYRMLNIKDHYPIHGYLQAVIIMLYVFVVVFMAATLLGKSPWGLFSILGGLTAVILLVFKDTILGFVAGIQLSANDMVQVGDWIEMIKYGADGDVIEVTVNTVKVQNWDKTISTIPTYALMSESFKNWRGMSESGGRRIKRSVNLDMNSIRFVDEDMLARFRKIDLLSDYVQEKQLEIDTHNQGNGVNLSIEVNGRRQTNVGIFRAYLQHYLHHHPMVNEDMTFLIRQLQPMAQGLPIEIYVFCRDQIWASYEAIQADLFDHVLAVIPEFGLRVFQSPSGADFQSMILK